MLVDQATFFERDRDLFVLEFFPVEIDNVHIINFNRFADGGRIGNAED